MGRRMGSDVDGEVIGQEFKGYTFRITGGNDQQGFTMKQGILVNGRVKILMKNRTTLYRLRRKAVMKRNKQQRWKASKEAAQSYEKILSKYLKEKKAAAKKEAAAATAAKATTK